MSRRRPVLGLLALICALCAGQVQAQIVVVRLADEKAARRYKKAADGLLLTGEPRTELVVGPGGELGPGDGELELFVLDRKDPAREVWRLKKTRDVIQRQKTTHDARRSHTLGSEDDARPRLIGLS